MKRQEFKLATGLDEDALRVWYPEVIAAMRAYSIHMKTDQALFMSFIMRDSVLFTKTVDDFEYSTSDLKQYFPALLSGYQADMLGGAKESRANGEAICNLGFARRYGNSGRYDGWKYRPRGLLRLVGRENYKLCGKALGINLLDNPELLELPQYAALSAAWLWRHCECNKFTSLPTIANCLNSDRAVPLPREYYSTLKKVFG